MLDKWIDRCVLILVAWRIRRALTVAEKQGHGKLPFIRQLGALTDRELRHARLLSREELIRENAVQAFLAGGNSESNSEERKVVN